MDQYRDPTELLRLLSHVHATANDGRKLKLIKDRKEDAVSALGRAADEMPAASREEREEHLFRSLARFAISIHDDYVTDHDVSFVVMELLLNSAGYALPSPDRKSAFLAYREQLGTRQVSSVSEVFRRWRRSK